MALTDRLSGYEEIINISEELMQIEVNLYNTKPEFLEDILPVMSDELVMQIKDKKRTLVMDHSEFEEMLTELSALKNHSEEDSPSFQKKVDFALKDFMADFDE